MSPRAWWVALALAGCANDFNPAWGIPHFRLFGARIENTTRRGDPAHPDPGATEAAPGETVHLALVAVDPSPTPRPLQVAWIFCPQARQAGGALTCGAPGSTGTTVAMGPEVDYTLPLSGFGTDAMFQPRIQALAYACAGGAIALDPTTHAPGCTGAGAEGWAMTRSIVVRLGEGSPVNHLPAIADVRIYRNGDLASPPASLGPDGAPTHVPRCTGDGCPTHVIEIVPAPDARETYTAPGPDGEPTTMVERIQFGYATTGGLLDGEFRVDTAQTPAGPIRNTWTPPTAPGPVRLVFTAEDPRGGFDATLRTIVAD